MSKFSELKTDKEMEMYYQIQHLKWWVIFPLILIVIWFLDS